MSHIDRNRIADEVERQFFNGVGELFEEASVSGIVDFVLNAAEILPRQPLGDVAERLGLTRDADLLQIDAHLQADRRKLCALEVVFGWVGHGSDRVIGISDNGGFLAFDGGLEASDVVADGDTLEALAEALKLGCVANG